MEDFESLLDDPILSSNTADEITTVDEEGGVDSREVAEGGEEPEENSDAENERSDKEEEEEEEDAGKPNSNDLKNLPSNLKCTSRGFQGCDDKCTVEDLTPYQVRKHINLKL